MKLEWTDAEYEEPPEQTPCWFDVIDRHKYGQNPAYICRQVFIGTMSQIGSELKIMRLGFVGFYCSLCSDNSKVNGYKLLRWAKIPEPADIQEYTYNE